MVKHQGNRSRLEDKQPGRIKTRPGKNYALNANVERILQSKNDIIIMGLDISSNSSGWSVMDASGKLIAYGVIKPSGIVPDRLRQTRNELSGILNKYQPTLCAIEDMIALKFAGVAKLLNYFNGVVYLTCFDYNGNDVVFIASSAMKAAIGVNPRALKKEGYDRSGIKEIIYNKICQLYGIKIPDDSVDYKYRHDIADAILCAHKLLIDLKGENKNG